MQDQYTPNQQPQYQPQQYPPNYQQQPPNYQQQPPNYQQQPYQQQQVIQPTIIYQQQPNIVDQGPQQFKNPLCGCMKNCPVCLISCCCCFVLAYNHAQAINKATKGVSSCCQACILDWLGCCCFNRQALRRAYNIEGSLVEDCCLMMFCPFCGMMQDYYEAEDRG